METLTIVVSIVGILVVGFVIFRVLLDTTTLSYNVWLDALKEHEKNSYQSPVFMSVDNTYFQAGAERTDITVVDNDGIRHTFVGVSTFGLVNCAGFSYLDKRYTVIRSRVRDHGDFMQVSDVVIKPGYPKVPISDHDATLIRNYHNRPTKQDSTSGSIKLVTPRRYYGY